MRKVIKVILLLLLTVILLFAGFLGWQTLTEFKPSTEEVLTIDEVAPAIDDTLTIISWNTGYFGLGAEMDFFYEGGKMVRPSKELYQKYRRAALERIQSFDTAAFIFLQEVDTQSGRTYFDNQLNVIKMMLPDYKEYYGTNYYAWVPIPPLDPMGKVRAGIVTLSQYSPVSAKRISFESSYSWPMRLFQLKRCFLELRFNTKDGKELILINTHNSAFSDAAALREKELNSLKTIMLDEYKKGNYVIIGGDWNQNPPGFDTTLLLPIYKSKKIYPGIPENLIPKGWVYAYDPSHTTNRDVDIPYLEGSTFSTLIDFFVLSPNVRLRSVKTIPSGYREADHQPVVLKVVL